MTKLEEVAQALCRRDCGKAWDQYLDDARAAVEALKELSDEIAVVDRNPVETQWLWRKVIDAILNETPGEKSTESKP